jgi:2-polyprenyl-3-methyl-5-hydroxy-6-metoxy-1,4-benzoquinol methylase
MPAHEKYLSVNFSTSNKPKSEYPTKLAGLLLGHLPRGKCHLLDVGSGRGDLAKAFRELGCDVEVADVNPEASDMAGSDFVFHSISKGGEIAASSGKYDAVLFKSVIEHLHDPYPLLAELRRVMKVGGTLITLTPDWTHNEDVFYDAVGHVQPYTKRSLSLTLEIASFSVKSCESFRQVPWTWSRIGRYIASGLGPAFRLIPRRFRSPNLRFLRETTLLAVAIRE